MRPNWFIGLSAPSPPWYPDLVADAPDGVRPFPPEDLHLTVAFLGGVDEGQAHAAWELTDTFDEGPFDVTLDRVQPMGNPRRASALAALLDQGRADVAQAMGRHATTLLTAAGARPETREPVPHLTLARIHRRASKPERRRAIEWARALPVAGLPLRLETLALYTWSRERPRRLFRVVAERPLGAP